MEISNIEEIKELEKTIKEANNSYYNFNEQIITDEEYDLLLERLSELDNKNDLLKNIGNNIINVDNFFKKVKHNFIAGSEAKVQNSKDYETEIQKFDDETNNSIRKKTLTPKMDGITTVATYVNDLDLLRNEISELKEYTLQYINNSNKSKTEKEKTHIYITNQIKKLEEHLIESESINFNEYLMLSRVASRGDGHIGENITINALNFQNTLKKIPLRDIKKELKLNNNEIISQITIRSESLIKFNDFKELKKRDPIKKNPRNAMGLHRNTQGINTELITSIPFDLIVNVKNNNEEKIIYLNKSVLLNLLKKIGFEIPFFNKTFNNNEEMEKEIKKIFDLMNVVSEKGFESNKLPIPYLLDGVVIDLEDGNLKNQQGIVNNKSKGSFAYKPPHQSGIGYLKTVDIEEQFTIGKTGNTTPMFYFKESIKLDGIDILKASGANIIKYKELLPFEGAKVLVSRRNGVIPKVEKNLDFANLYIKLTNYINENIVNNIKDKKIKDKLINLIIKDELHLKINYYIYDNLNKGIFDLFEKEFEILLNDKQKSEIKDIINDKQIQKKYCEFYDKRIKFPTNCPICHTPLLYQNVYVKCGNKDCFGVKKASLVDFVQKLTDGLNQATIEELIIRDKINKYSDLFNISIEDFKEIQNNKENQKIIFDNIKSKYKENNLSQIKITDIDENIVFDIEGLSLTDKNNFTDFIDENYLLKNVDFEQNETIEISSKSFNLKSTFLKGWSNTSIKKLLKSIDKMKTVKDNELFGVLGFENIGKTIFLKLFQTIPFKDVLNTLNNFDILIDENILETIKDKEIINNIPKEYIEFYKKLLELDGLSHITIINLINTWILNKENINELLKHLNIIKTEVLNKESKTYTVVITGSIEPSNNKLWSDRKTMTKYLKELGHTVSGSVSSKTEYLITDDSDLSSSKAKKAQSLIDKSEGNIKGIIGSKDFENILNNHNHNHNNKVEINI